MRRGADGHVPFAAEQAGGGIKPDPAGAGQIDFGPCVQIGEVAVRALGAFQRIDVGGELHEIAGDETGGQPKTAQHLHHQPCAVAARA